MSADRYEIIYREKPEFVTAECSIEIRFGNRSLHLFSGCSFLETHIAGAIRQQARDLDQLRTDLAAAVARAEQAEARLAAIESAPTVAMLCPLTESAFNESTLMTAYQKAKMPHVELIARPAKD